MNPKIYSYFFSLLILSPVLSADQQTKKNQLVQAAKERLSHQVVYDGRYQRLAYPMGDVADNRGVCSDVIIRSYRALGLDLQKKIHEDMRRHFSAYPKNWGLKRTDKNIDHRRVPNLQTFFKRQGASLKISRNPQDYKAGDLVTWRVAGHLPHIGIVVDQRSKDNKRPLIIHNIGLGPKMDDMLFNFPITGHYRYFNF